LADQVKITATATTLFLFPCHHCGGTHYREKIYIAEKRVSAGIVMLSCCIVQKIIIYKEQSSHPFVLLLSTGKDFTL